MIVRSVHLFRVVAPLGQWKVKRLVIESLSGRDGLSIADW